uniref:Uncharacterized protein n=1 Tax=Panstrongylus lignarius TaxID=156445 RepID=A0A224XZQ0_9HEMI
MKWIWEMSKIAKHQDTLASSEYSDVVPFRPSFEHDKSHPDMFDLLSMEYARVWERELEYARSIPLVQKDESTPILIRPQIMKRRIKANVDDEYIKPMFFIKKFLKVPARVNSFRSTDDEVWNKMKSDKQINKIEEHN